jgi:membrane protease YdiL (CAAX protease family)
METQLRASRWQKVPVAGAWGALVVLAYFAPWFFSSFLYENWTPSLAYHWVFIIAATAALLAAAVAVTWSQCQVRLIRILAVTTFIYVVWRLAIPWVFWLSKLPLTPEGQYWVYKGPGSGSLGLLPSAIVILVAGRFVFGLSLREQWNGRLSLTLRDLWYGGSVGVAMSLLALICAALAGGGRLAWEPNWAQNGVNLFSNLYEEILVRSLLLQIVRREAGAWVAMFWTGLVFGSMHGLTWLALSFALVTWIIAWVVLKAGSLWAGWVFHQVIDVIVDSTLH